MRPVNKLLFAYFNRLTQQADTSILGNSKLIKRIFHDSKELAIVIPGSYRGQGIEFLTSNAYSQQLGYMNRPAGYIIEPHIHNLVSREVHLTQEVLFIKKGVVRVDFYSDLKVYVESAILEAGDIILLASGGHGFEVIEEAEIVEVKQGPYLSDRDKTRFEGVTSN